MAIFGGHFSIMYTFGKLAAGATYSQHKISRNQFLTRSLDALALFGGILSRTSVFADLERVLSPAVSLNTGVGILGDRHEYRTEFFSAADVTTQTKASPEVRSAAPYLSTRFLYGANDLDVALCSVYYQDAIGPLDA